MFTLVFGIVEFGTAFGDFISLRQGAREGARQAVVASFGSNASCPLFPAPSSSDTGKLMCLVKDRIDPAHPELIRVKVLFPDAGGYQVGNAIRVCAQYELHSRTNFLFLGPMLDDRRLSTRVDMRAETLSTTAGADHLAAAEETSFPGGWSC